MDRVEKYSWFESDVSMHFTWGLTGTISDVLKAFTPKTSSVDFHMLKTGDFYRMDASTPVKMAHLNAFEKALKDNVMESSIDKDCALLVYKGLIHDGFLNTYSCPLMWDWGIWNPIIDPSQFLRIKVLDEEADVRLRVYGRRTNMFNAPMIYTPEVWEDEELIGVLVKTGFLKETVSGGLTLDEIPPVKLESAPSKPGWYEDNRFSLWLSEQGVHGKSLKNLDEE